MASGGRIPGKRRINTKRYANELKGVGHPTTPLGLLSIKLERGGLPHSTTRPHFRPDSTCKLQTDALLWSNHWPSLPLRYVGHILLVASNSADLTESGSRSTSRCTQQSRKKRRTTTAHCGAIWPSIFIRPAGNGAENIKSTQSAR